MKLRLPLSLLFALSLSWTAAHAADVDKGDISDMGTITEDTNFTGSDQYMTTGKTVTVGTAGGGSSPVVNFSALDMRTGGQLDILSGKVSCVEEKWESYSTVQSLILNGKLNMRGGELISTSIHLSRADKEGTMNLYGGTVRTTGIYSYQKADSDQNSKFGTINLVGGTLELGKQGLWTYHATDFSAIAVNLFSGTLGAYESWSSGDKTWQYKDSQWTESAHSKNTIEWQLDYAGALLPDGTVSDGTGSLTIAPAEGTTITAGSLIKGTGTGDFIKSGKGTLVVTRTDNTFTQNVVLAGGDLVINKNGSLGEITKTITVIDDDSADSSSFDMTGLDWSLRYTDYSFLVKNGAKLIFPKGNDVMFDFSGKLTFESGATVVFEDEIMLDNGGGMGAAIEKMTVEQGSFVTLKDSFYLSKSTQVTLSGTMTVEKAAASGESTPDGLIIGGYHGNMWNTSRFIIGEGGLLEMKKVKVSLGKFKETGEFIINEGGKAVVWGIEDKGAWGKVILAGGTLELGKGGIHFTDQSDNDDGSDKSGENYLSDVYFSSGKMTVSEDSAYTYTGRKIFDAISNRPASVYTGNFFFGKDDTGVLDDPASRREIEVGEGATFTLSEIILGDGGFNKTGKGTVVLSVTNGFKGDTVVEEGTLHLGDNGALGTEGKLTLLSGTTLAALGKSVIADNDLDMGTVDDSDYKVTFGQIGKTESLTLGGTANLLARGTEINALSDVTFAGDVISNTAELDKIGAGVLGFSQALSGIQILNVKAGGVVLGGTSFDGVKTLNMAANTSLDLGGQAGSADRLVNIIGITGLKGFDAYVGEVMMKEYESRLNVTGNFKAGKISFKLGWDNATFDGAGKTLVNITPGGTATITGTEKGSIVLDFDADYINTFLNQGGRFQLFSTGLNYQKGTILNNQRKIIMLDESVLSATGALVWNRIALSADLITQDMADRMSGYVPSGTQSYLGSQGGKVVVGENVFYDLEDNNSYNLTPGLGTLVYRGLLEGADRELSIVGYAEIKDGVDPGTGSVVITNNDNSYGRGTIVTGGRLTVDLSESADPGAVADLVKNGNVNVTALGTGKVVGVSGAKGGSEIILQSYGNTAGLDAGTTFTYANEFSLSGNTVLKQAGAYAQILNGDIMVGSGANSIVNIGDKVLTMRGNITQEDGESLTLRSEINAGKIVLDGGNALTASQLRIAGSGEVRITNDYLASVRKLTMDGGTLTVGENGTLSVGQEGITGTGTLAMNGGTIKSASSWESGVVVTLGAGTNTINTGGAIVRLNQGVTGEGGFAKQGTGHLYVYDNAAGNAKGLMDIKQGRLVLLGTPSTQAEGEYNLNGDLTLSSGKGASLQGKINSNGHNVTFGEGTHFYLEVTGEAGVTGYIRDAGTISIGTGTQLHVDVLDDTWTTENTYSIFTSREDIQGAGNLELALNGEYAFVDVNLDLSDSKEIGLYLTRKGGTPGGGQIVGDGTNAGAIHAAVAPLVAGVLDDSTELTGKLNKHMQKVSKMTTTEYKTYLEGMGNSASSFYTALSAQVQDATQHINSVRNRVELLNPVMYDDWTEGGIYNVWAGGINHYRDVKSGSEAPGYEMTSWGGELGCAIPLSQTFMIGVGFAYTFADVQVKDGWGNNDNDTYSVDFFARYRKDALTITGVLTGGFTNTEFHRNQILKDEYTRSNSSTDGNQFMGTIEVGYDFYLNQEKSWILQPLVNITAGRAKLDGLSETGDLKNAGLMIGSQSYNMFSAGIGAKIAYEYKNSVSDLPGRVELKAMYVNDMGDVDFKVNGSFIGAPQNGFELNGISNERSAAIVSAGWVAPISAYGQFFVDAGCEFRKDQNGVNTTVGFSFQF